MPFTAKLQSLQRPRTEFLREGVYYLLVFAFVMTGAILRNINMMMLIAGVMVGLLVYNWRKSVAMLRKVSVGRSIPHDICVGDMLVADIIVQNDSRRSKRGVVITDKVERVDATADAEQSETSIIFEHVSAGTQRTQSYQGRIWTRGRYRFGPLAVSCRYPFGLVSRRGQVEDVRDMLVFPRIGRLLPNWSKLLDVTLVGSRRVRRRQSQTEGDFYGLRDWREGDSQRWIHWRTSVRRGKPVVRQYERQQRQDLSLLVDLWLPNQPTQYDQDSVELAVSFAATVVADLCRRGGSHLDLAVAGQKVSAVRGVASAGLMAEMLATLAVVQADEHDLLENLVAQGLSKVARSGRTILISTRNIEPAELTASTELPDRLTERIHLRPFTSINTSNREIDEYFSLD